MAKGYWIAHVDVHNDDGYKPYAAANPAIFKKFGGRFVVRGGKFENPEGASRSRNVVIEFPDYAAALACYRSPEYQANIKVRQPNALSTSSSSKATTARSRNLFRRVQRSTPCPRAIGFRRSTSAIRKATRPTWRRRRRRTKNIAAPRWCAAARWRWWRAACVRAPCCANSPTTPPRSPATARDEYQRAKPLRLPHSQIDFIIVEGYDGPQPQPPQGATPPAAAAAKGYWIGQVDVTDMEGYKPYMSANQAPFGAFGGRYLVRGGTREVPEGKARARIVVLEFPSYDAALACYRSPEYQAAKKLREGKGDSRPRRRRGLRRPEVLTEV